MTVLHVFWLPILLSAVAVFIVSSVIHMFLPWHKGDYAKVPNENGVMDALRPFALAPGDYMLPRPASTADMKSAEFCDKLNKGPVMMATVLPSGPFKMGKSLALWFLYAFVVAYFAAYVAVHAHPGWSGYRAVFRFAGLTAFLAYAGALAQFSIWYHRSWVTTFKTMIDGVVYAAITAGLLGWLWPK